MSRSPVIVENGRAVETQPQAVIAATLKALLVARRRSLKAELAEIERLLKEIGVT